MSHKQAVVHLQKLRDTARSAGVAESVRGVQEAAACDQQRGGQQADRPTAHGGAAQQRSAATAHGQGMPPDLPLPLLWCSLGSWANGGSYHLMVWRDFVWVHVAVCWRAIGSLTGALFGQHRQLFFQTFSSLLRSPSPFHRWTPADLPATRSATSIRPATSAPSLWRRCTPRRRSLAKQRRPCGYTWRCFFVCIVWIWDPTFSRKT